MLSPRSRFVKFASNLAGVVRNLSDVGAKRTQAEMIVEILALCRTQAHKTRIMQRANMSYPQLQKSMERLQSCEFLRLDAETNNYSTTEKGLEFLRRYSALVDLLKP